MGSLFGGGSKSSSSTSASTSTASGSGLLNISKAGKGGKFDLSGLQLQTTYNTTNVGPSAAEIQGAIQSANAGYLQQFQTGFTSLIDAVKSGQTSTDTPGSDAPQIITIPTPISGGGGGGGGQTAPVMAASGATSGRDQSYDNLMLIIAAISLFFLFKPAS